MKKIISLLIIFIGLFTISFAHSGRTDSSGGHYNRSTGEYHYHHGYSAHQHYNGICPYESSITTSQEDESIVISTEEEGEEIIDNYEKQIEELQEEVRNKDETIEELNGDIEEKNNKIEQLKDDKGTLHFIYWFVIICMGIAIWNLKKENK